MKNKLYFVGLGLVVALAISGIVQAQRWGSLIEWISQEKVNDHTKAWTLVVRDIGRLIDDYTTLTTQQKFDAIVKASEAICSGTQPKNIVGLLSPIEKANVKIVWLALEAEYQNQDALQDAAQEDIFRGEIPD